MKNLIVFLCVIVALFSSSLCWVINEINTEMIISNAVDDVPSEVKEAGLQKISFIYPGTKWCGAGNVADSDEDLGSEKEADICCRDHDHCPDFIEGGQHNTQYNLTNKVFYTRLSCTCDESFHSCLKAASTRTAKVIGNIYFDALRTKCFRKDYPVKSCIKKGGFLKSKCAQYSYDTNSDKLYQWFDVQDF